MILCKIIRSTDYRVFIRYRRSENSPFIMDNSPADFR